MKVGAAWRLRRSSGRGGHAKAERGLEKSFRPSFGPVEVSNSVDGVCACVERVSAWGALITPEPSSRAICATVARRSAAIDLTSPFSSEDAAQSIETVRGNDEPRRVPGRRGWRRVDATSPKGLAKEIACLRVTARAVAASARAREDAAHVRRWTRPPMRTSRPPQTPGFCFGIERQIGRERAHVGTGGEREGTIFVKLNSPLDGFASASAARGSGAMKSSSRKR